MTSLNYDIKDKLKRLSAFEKIIAVNLVIYVIGKIFSLSPNIDSANSLQWLSLPSSISKFITRPWACVTYGFTHIEFWHLFFNMLILYFIGRSFSNLFNLKTSLNVYFLGIISGGVLFLISYAALPNGLLYNVGTLVGASAGVRALLLFLCTYMPSKEMAFGPVKIKLLYVGLILVFFDVVGLFGNNQGGNIAHLGGAALGYLYAIQLKKGIDIGKGFEKIMDAVFDLFSFQKKSKLKTVYKQKGKPYAGHTKSQFNEFNKQKRIDIILDKISKSGYDSLNKEEKEFLFKAGK